MPKRYFKTTYVGRKRERVEISAEEAAKLNAPKDAAPRPSPKPSASSSTGGSATG